MNLSSGNGEPFIYDCIASISKDGSSELKSYSFRWAREVKRDTLLHFFSSTLWMCTSIVFLKLSQLLISLTYILSSRELQVKSRPASLGFRNESKLHMKFATSFTVNRGKFSKAIHRSTTAQALSFRLEAYAQEQDAYRLG